MTTRESPSSERDIQTRILLELSRGDTRLLRINAGTAWQGRVIEQTATRLVLAYPRAIRLAAPGVSDLIGWRTVEVGNLALAQLVALEVKAARGRVSVEQQAWLDTVRRAGGVAGVVRSVEDARAVLAQSVERE